MTANAQTPRSDRIVVGVDGSESSMQALRWARYLAGATGDGVEVVTAWQARGAYNMGVIPEQNASGDADPLATATNAVEHVYGEAKPATVQITVHEGHAAKVLIDASDGARMLLVGSRGLGGCSGLLLGSVSNTCSEHARCPVLIVHGSSQPPAS